MQFTITTPKELQPLNFELSTYMKICNAIINGFTNKKYDEKADITKECPRIGRKTVTRMLIGECIFIYSRSARLISVEINLYCSYIPSKCISGCWQPSNYL